MLEAYSHEVSSCGYWPGGDGEGVFYSYAYPEPPGYRDAKVGPGGASFDESLGEYVLAYEAVRTAADPDAFCSSSCSRATRPLPTAPPGTGRRSSAGTQP